MTMGDVMEAALLANLAATLFMVGLIWFVQVVHYPLLGMVGPDRHVEVANRHTRLTGLVVGPAMAVEGVTTLALLVDRPDGVSVGLPWVAAVLLAVALGSTVALQVPLHSHLATTHDPEASRRLVATNWIRTIAWSCRGAIVLTMTAQAI